MLLHALFRLDQSLAQCLTFRRNIFLFVFQPLASVPYKQKTQLLSHKRKKLRSSIDYRQSLSNSG